MVGQPPVTLDAYFTPSTESRPLHDNHMSFKFPAPVAPMMSSPSSTRPLPTGRLPPVGEASKCKGRPSRLFSPPRLRSTRKSTPDYKDEYNRTEMARDRTDTDYRLSQDTPKKRRATSDISPRSGKRTSQRHVPYDNCKDSASRTERDRHLARIRENWAADTEQWMPASIWPCSGPRRSRQPLQDPRDWSGSLLKELSYLSAVTKDKPGVAYQALRDAVAQRQEEDGRDDNTRLLKEDVQYATQIRKSAGPELLSPGSANGDGDVTNETDAEGLLNKVLDGLPNLRSPTFAGDDPIIKMETLAVPTSKSKESVANDAWTGYDDELEKLEESRLEAEENEAIAAAKRAQREQLKIRRLIRERWRNHGRTKEDAIPLGLDVVV